jgi:hypothetical protein
MNALWAVKETLGFQMQGTLKVGQEVKQVHDFGSFAVHQTQSHTCGQEIEVVYSMKMDDGFCFSLNFDPVTYARQVSLSGPYSRVEYKNIEIKNNQLVCMHCGESIFSPANQVVEEK